MYGAWHYDVMTPGKLILHRYFMDVNRWTAYSVSVEYSSLLLRWLRALISASHFSDSSLWHTVETLCIR